ncbi:MAG: CoA-disulfide reductase [Akkermansiaceae bacterium]|nr:CoA-disulfide reductase [Akkermansiaceae bacterium]
MSKKRTIIVGGVAGGATVAARLSRLGTEREIIIIERGEHVSFANCGLPYYIGGVIEKESSLLLATPELFRTRYGIDVLLRHEVYSIDPQQRTVGVTNLVTGEKMQMPYDELVLSPGAAPLRPPMPGVDLPGVMTLRTVPDANAIRRYIAEHKVRRALVIGAGFIGLEVAENLQLAGIEVSLVEGGSHVLPPLDAHMSTYVEELLAAHGVGVEVGKIAKGIRRCESGRLQAYNDTWNSAEADLILLSVGVRPEISLAQNAGLRIGETGAIWVDEHMRTSAPGVWAVGDAVQTTNRITGLPTRLAMAGVAQKQARVAADDIAGRPTVFTGVVGTAVLRLFGTTISMTGLNIETLTRSGDSDYEYVDGHHTQHVGYYPGASPIHARLVYRRSNGKLLGYTAIGKSGAARRTDVVAALLACNATVHDLAAAELSYSPQEGSPKDAVNQLALAAVNNLEGLHPIAHKDDINADSFLLDVREPAEVLQAPYPGAVNIPLSQLRARVQELPHEQKILVFCQSGVRGHTATSLLNNMNYRACHLSGGYLTLSR